MGLEDYLELSIQLQQELEAMPREYSEYNSIKNRDIMNSTAMNYNLGRFMIFLDNYRRGIPDKIKITVFDAKSISTVSILYYDGNMMVYVVDATRYPSEQFYTFYGKEIAYNINSKFSYAILNYNLVSLDKTEVPILNIWAGYDPID